MQQIDVKILDREYKLAVSAEERDRVVNAARIVDEKMRGIRESGRIAGVDRIAVMAALQLANELIDARNPPDAPKAGEMLRRIRSMSEEIDEALKRQESLF